MRTEWNNEDIEYLINNYSFTKNIELSKVLNRTIYAIYSKAEKLKLRKIKIVKKEKEKRIVRQLTEEKLTEIAKQYKTRGEFQENDPSAYGTARRKFDINKICKHMVIGNYSKPQLLLNEMVKILFNKTTKYNCRTIIKPYELDIYIEEFKLAFVISKTLDVTMLSILIRLLTESTIMLESSANIDPVTSAVIDPGISVKNNGASEITDQGIDPLVASTNIVELSAKIEPVTSPTTFPVTLPVKSPNTSPVRLPVTLPATSPVTLAKTGPTILPLVPSTNIVESSANIDPVTSPVIDPVIDPVILIFPVPIMSKLLRSRFSKSVEILTTESILLAASCAVPYTNDMFWCTPLTNAAPTVSNACSIV
jgi:hypothetical protein